MCSTTTLETGLPSTCKVENIFNYDLIFDNLKSSTNLIPMKVFSNECATDDTDKEVHTGNSVVNKLYDESDIGGSNKNGKTSLLFKTMNEKPANGICAETSFNEKIKSKLNNSLFVENQCYDLFRSIDNNPSSNKMDELIKNQDHSDDPFDSLESKDLLLFAKQIAVGMVSGNTIWSNWFFFCLSFIISGVLVK